MCSCCGTRSPDSPPCGRRTGRGGPTPPEHTPPPDATRPGRTRGVRKWPARVWERLEAEARLVAARAAPGGAAGADDDLGLLGEWTTADYFGARAVADSERQHNGAQLAVLAHDPHASGLTPAPGRTIRPAPAARPAVLPRPPLAGRTTLAGGRRAPRRVAAQSLRVRLHSGRTEAQGGVRNLEHVVAMIRDNLDVGRHAGEQLEVGVVGRHHDVVGNDVLNVLGRLAHLGDGPREGARGEGVHREGRLLPDLDPTHIRLVYVC